MIDLSDEAYDIMREDIRLAKEAGEENDDSDEEDENEADNETVLDIFLKRFVYV